MPKDGKNKGSNKKSTKGQPGNKNKGIAERAKNAAEREEKAKQARSNTKGAELIIPKDDNYNIQRGLYTDEILPKLEALAAKGLNNADIAKSLGIGNKTFYEWRHRYPQFAHALAKYRGVADIFVENALYNTAIGYQYTEESVTPTGKVVQVIKYMPGNAAAQKFYLTNRMAQRYKNKVETEITAGKDVTAMAIVIRRREE
jgi:hypothetical protein